MTRSRLLGWSTAAVALLCGMFSTAESADFAQHMGFGYGAGYNAPPPPIMTGGWPGCASGLVLGCCEVPAHWRLHVWDGYGLHPHALKWTDGVVMDSPGVMGSGFVHSGCSSCKSCSRACCHSCRPSCCPNAASVGSPPQPQPPIPVASPTASVRFVPGRR
jgi:hypothetical protein